MKKLLLLLTLTLNLLTTNAQGKFIHPGLLHTQADIDAIKQRLQDGDATTKKAYAVLQESWIAQKAVEDVWGITEYIKRGISGDENYMNAYRNAAKAYQCALLWKITGETQWADKALYILNQYPQITVGIGGNTNQSLVPGFIGYQFLNAAELMRDCDKWTQQEIETFKQWMIDVWFTTAQDFLERRHDTVTNYGIWYHYHSNWGLGNALFCISLGIFADLPDIYNYGMYWIKEGPGNESLYVADTHPKMTTQGMCGYGWGLIPWFHQDQRGPMGYLCQMQESGRDQGHAMAALGLLSYALQTAYNQGDNAFCNLDNTLIDGLPGSTMVAGGAEYVAMYNCQEIDDTEIPFTTNWWMTALNATSRGQDRPIWQLYLNHYQNRMGITMPYCKKMTEIVGIEAGGGSYGTNSGGFDHTGFGTLMHNDTPVTQQTTPTILFPQIIQANGTVRPYAEIKNVTPGTTLTLTAQLPTDETNTGLWQWEDGQQGQTREITADSSYIYRLYYTNTQGIQSTQMFSVSVHGQGIKATLTPYVTYNNVTSDNTSTFSAVNGREVTLGVNYANWNYVTSTIWYDANGKLLESSSTYTFRQGSTDQTFTCILTNESGVQITQQFTIYNSVLIPTLTIDGTEQENLIALVPPGCNAVMKGTTTSIRYRNGTYKWNTGETTDSLTFNNIQTTTYRHLDWIDTSSTVRNYQASFDFQVKVYQTGQVIPDGIYRIQDKTTEYCLNNATMTFQTPTDEDSLNYLWHLTYIPSVDRYKIQTHNDTAYINNEGQLTTRVYSQARSSYTLYLIVGGDQQECLIQTPERYGAYYWQTQNNTLLCDNTTTMPADFNFILQTVQQDNNQTAKPTTQTTDNNIIIKTTTQGLTVSTTQPTNLTLYNTAGIKLINKQIPTGTTHITKNNLPHGLYIIHTTHGTTHKNTKIKL